MITIIPLIVVYQILQLVLFPFIALFILMMHIKRSVIGNFKERIGFIPASNTNKIVVWIHAVSVGEVLSVQELINFIKESIPNSACYLTVGTISGKKIAAKYIITDTISFLPYDFLPYMLMAYHRIKPKALIVIEAELWPNLLGVGKMKKIPMFLVNARINPRSKKRVAFFKPIYKVLINCFDIIFAQSTNDRESFHNIGIAAHKVTTLGNLKAFNAVMKQQRYQQLYTKKQSTSHPITMLVGSMHPGEDIIYLEMYAILKKEFPNLKLILVPRHFAWQQELIKHVDDHQFSYFTWTERQPIAHAHESRTNALQRIFSQHDVLLVCKLGELFDLYMHADIYFLGGTFVPIGGHNLLEPAIWGIPTVLGPFFHNCQDIADRLESIHGIIKTKNPKELLEATRTLLMNQNKRLDIGQASHKWIIRESTSVSQALQKLILELKKLKPDA